MVNYDRNPLNPILMIGNGLEAQSGQELLQYVVYGSSRALGFCEIGTMKIWFTKEFLKASAVLLVVFAAGAGTGYVGGRTNTRNTSSSTNTSPAATPQNPCRA